MDNKRRGKRAMAVMLSAAMALSPVGSVLAETGVLERMAEAVRDAIEDLYEFPNGIYDENVNSGTSTSTSTGTRTGVLRFITLTINLKDEEPIYEHDELGKNKFKVVYKEECNDVVTTIDDFEEDERCKFTYKKYNSTTGKYDSVEVRDDGTMEAGQYKVQARAVLDNYTDSVISEELDFVIESKPESTESVLTFGDNTEEESAYSAFYESVKDAKEGDAWYGAPETGNMQFLTIEEAEAAEGGKAGNSYKVTGELPYIKGWTGFSSDEKMQSGHYLAVVLKKPEGMEITGDNKETPVITFIGTQESTYTLGQFTDKTSTGEDVLLQIIYVSDKTKESGLTYEVDWDGEGEGYASATYKVDLSGLTLKAEETADESVLTFGDKTEEESAYSAFYESVKNVKEGDAWYGAPETGSMQFLTIEEAEAAEGGKAGNSYKVTGELPYIKGWTGFSSDEKMQSGHYLAVVLKKPEGMEITGDNKETPVITFTGTQESTYTLGQFTDKTSTGEDVLLQIIYVSDKTKESGLTYKVDWDGKDEGYASATYKVDLSGLTLKAEETADESVLTFGDKTEEESAYSVFYENVKDAKEGDAWYGAPETGSMQFLTIEEAEAAEGGKAGNSYKVTGELPYIKGWTGFSSDEKMQSGHYLAVVLKKPEGMEITGDNKETPVITFTGTQESTYTLGQFTDKTSTSEDVLLQIIYVSDETKTKGLTYEVDWDGKGEGYAPATYKVDLSGLTLLEEGVVDEKEIALKLSDVKITYGDTKIDVDKNLSITRINGGEIDETTLETLKKDVTYFYAAASEAGEENAEKPEWLEGLPRNAGSYQIKASFAGNDIYNAAESEVVTLTILKKEITVKAKSQNIANGARLPETVDIIEIEPSQDTLLPYEDSWDDIWKSPISISFEKDGEIVADIDTTKEGQYKIKVHAEISEKYEANYCVTTSEDGTLTIAAKDGELKELTLTLADAEFIYGDKSVEEIDKAVCDGFTAVVNNEEKKDITKDLARDKYEIQYFDADGKELEAAPVKAGSYTMKAIYFTDGLYQRSESTVAKLTIQKRTITVTAKDIGVKNGLETPPTLEITVDGTLPSGDGEPKYKLPYDDKWKIEPTAAVQPLDGKTEVDWKEAGEYKIIVTAEIEESCKENYNDIVPVPGKLNIAEAAEDGRSIVKFSIAEEDKTKTYDGKPMDITDDMITNKSGYTGAIVQTWKTEDGKAPKNAGKYQLVLSVPDNNSEYVSENNGAGNVIDITIGQKDLTVQAVSTVAPDPDGKIRTYAGEPVKMKTEWSGFAEGESEKEGVIKDAVVKVISGDVNKEGSYKVQASGGEVNSNYKIAGYGNEIEVIVTAERKPVISTATFPKKKDEYSAVYTGEEIRPTMTVYYSYYANGKPKNQKLKLNVDYTVSYSDNMNVAYDKDGNVTKGAQVTITGIGEYAGVITKEYTITPKSIKKVTLSPVGDIEWGDEPSVVVMDGIYELIEGEDYEIKYATPYDPASGDKKDMENKLSVTGKGNYDSATESNKKVKFNILADLKGAKLVSTLKVTLKKPSKTEYTYNGKAQKPAVRVTDPNNKNKTVPSSQYKILYTNNVNVGTIGMQIVGVSKYNQKKGTRTGFVGTMDLTMDIDVKITQADFKKVSISTVSALPKNGSTEDAFFTVKQGKRILKEGVDYEICWTDVKNSSGKAIVENGNFVSDAIENGKKYELEFKSLGTNYSETTSKKIKIKFGQLNLASKTAKVVIELDESKARDAASNYGVTVTYNGKLLTAATPVTGKKDTFGDYYVTKQPKQNKTGVWTVSIKAAGKNKSCLYKGSKTVTSKTNGGLTIKKASASAAD